MTMHFSRCCAPTPCKDTAVICAGMMAMDGYTTVKPVAMMCTRDASPQTPRGSLVWKYQRSFAALVTPIHCIPFVYRLIRALAAVCVSRPHMDGLHRVSHANLPRILIVYSHLKDGKCFFITPLLVFRNQNCLQLIWNSLKF